jgi:hypothetical protein
MSQIIQEQNKKNTLQSLDELVISPTGKKTAKLPKKLQKTGSFLTIL